METHASPGPRRCIEVEGVSQTYRRSGRQTHALDNVSLSIDEGEFVAVVGPSGCGKSTLLRIIAGLLAHGSGTVRIDGRQIDGPQTRVGVVFQSPVLLEWRNVLDNVLVQFELRGLDPGAYRQRALDLLARVGLGDFRDRHPRELSGGMRQRVAIARALVHDPPLLLMDEPFGALDALTREQMRIDLEDLWMQTGKTVLFITHSVDEAVLLGDRVLVMSPRPGRIEHELRSALKRPRGLGARQLEAFAAASREITDIFLKRGVLHIAPPRSSAGGRGVPT
ncbi:MAG: ABC transporter ATP-binding protein [Proteobacteria bacterium]|nr:ABC transporter ATP-binding protein [Pseudomonadota bacterium]